MDDTDQPHDDQPEPISDKNLWALEKTKELTRRVMDGDLLPKMFRALRTTGKQLQAHETSGESMPIAVDDMLSIALAHVFYQALIAAHPELADEMSELSYVEAVHLLYVREHATLDHTRRISPADAPADDVTHVTPSAGPHHPDDTQPARGPRIHPPPNAKLVEQIRKAYAEGASGKEITETFGVSSSTVYRYLGNLPRHRPHLADRPHQTLTPDVISAIRKRYTSGQRMTPIARELGVSISTVVKHTRDLPRQGRGRSLDPETVTALYELLDTGHSAHAASKKLGISDPTARRYRNRRPTP